MLLDRLARDGAVTDPERIRDAYLDSVRERGASEIGFERPAGQSFNPRAARVVIILMQDARVFDSELLTEALQIAGRGELGYDKPLDERLRGAFLLDRLRHFHLERDRSNGTLFQSVGQEILEEIPDGLRLKVLLKKSLERLERSR
jgi:hypothetical protein